MQNFQLFFLKLWLYRNNHWNMLYFWNGAKQIFDSTVFSLESECVCPQSMRLKSPAQTSKEHWNCLFREAGGKEVAVSVIKWNQSHFMFLIHRCFYRRVPTTHSLLTPVTLQIWSWGFGTTRLWPNVVKSNLDSDPWVRFSALPLTSCDLGQLILPPQVLVSSFSVRIINNKNKNNATTSRDC